MEVNLKNNIYIKGFEKNNPFDKKNNDGDFFNHFHKLKDENIIYIGKTFDISEDVAQQCVNSMFFDSDIIGGGYDAYENYSEFDCWTDTAKESILSACKQKFCIIYRK